MLNVYRFDTDLFGNLARGLASPFQMAINRATNQS